MPTHGGRAHAVPRFVLQRHVRSRRRRARVHQVDQRDVEVARPVVTTRVTTRHLVVPRRNARLFQNPRAPRLERLVELPHDAQGRRIGTGRNAGSRSGGNVPLVPGVREDAELLVVVGHAPLAHEHAAHERGAHDVPRGEHVAVEHPERAHGLERPRGGVVRLPRERLGWVDVKPRVRAADARLVLVIPGTQHRGCGGVVRLTRRQTIGRRRTRGDFAARGSRLDRPRPSTRGAFLLARVAARRLGFAPRLLRGEEGRDLPATFFARARRPRRAVARSLVGLAHPGARRRSRRPRRPARDCEAERGGRREHLFYVPRRERHEG